MSPSPVPAKFHCLASDLKRDELAALNAQRYTPAECIGFLMLLVLACGFGMLVALGLRSALGG